LARRSLDRDRESEVQVPKFQPAIGAAGVAAVLALAGCNGPPWLLNHAPQAIAQQWYSPWTLDKSSTGISLRWYPDTTSSFRADQAAQLHCGSWNKTAELVSDTRDGSAEVADYRCR